MQDQIKKIQQDYINKIATAKSLKELDEIFIKLFGKNGEITLLPKEFSKLLDQEKKIVGPLFNQVKQKLEQVVANRRQEIREESYKNLADENLDLTKNVKINTRAGQLHPITKFEQEIVELFSKIGFQEYDAPEIDTDYNNFEVLNIPKEHPARDLWDTFYIDSKNQDSKTKLLLRTHTSNSQIKILKENQPPIRMMVLGRCFRYENLDARHEHTFEQFELVYVDKDVSMANLQYLSEYFLKAVFGPEIKVRMRPKYYPFVEPGVGVDGECVFCSGQGCKICGGTGWLELAGAGMIHPQVLKNAGIDSNEYSGIAWGFGPPRMVMLKNGFEDIRVFNSGNLKLLKGEK